jgi:hypothetical protein
VTSSVDDAGVGAKRLRPAQRLHVHWVLAVQLLEGPDVVTAALPERHLFDETGLEQVAG